MYLYWTKNQTGRKYYCLGENKKINGKSIRVKDIYLGTADKIYELIHSKNNLERINTYEYGLTIALLQSVRQFGVYKILKEVLPFKIRGVPASVVVIIIVLNKIIDPKSKNSINRWYRRSVISRLLPIEVSKLSSQFFFDCLQELDERNIRRIEYRMAKNVKQFENLDSILCDMTHIETYIGEHDGNLLPQRGRIGCKSGRRLVNLALMITRDNSIPLFHLSYPGNINDVTEFAEVVNVLEKRFTFLTGNGKEKITVMIDKGNNSKDNINGLEDAGYYFVGRLRPSAFEDLLCKPLSKFRDEYNESIRSYSTFRDVYGKRRKLVIKYDKDSYNKSYEEFMDLIERRKHEIQVLQRTVNYKLKHGSKRSKVHWFIEDNVNKAIRNILDREPTKGMFRYTLKHSKERIEIRMIINAEEYKKRINLIGKYILFTNRKRWDHNKIIKAFIDQYLIETQYRTLKGNRIKISPLNHWTDNSIRADIFLSFLSLQIMNLLLMHIRKKSVEMSNEQILDTLEQIKVSYCRLKGREEEFDMMNEMEDNEKLLYEMLNLKDRNTYSYIKRAFS